MIQALAAFRDKAAKVVHMVADDCGLPADRFSKHRRQFFKMHCPDDLPDEAVQYRAALNTSLSARGYTPADWRLLCRYRVAGNLAFHSPFSDDDLKTYLGSHSSFPVGLEDETVDLKPLFLLLLRAC